MRKDWLERLQTRLTRFYFMGHGADIALLSLIEIYGLYCYLSRLARN